MINIHINTNDVDSRLAELNLEATELAEIVRRGYVAFASCTPNDPPLFPGFSAWAMMVRSLREYLVPGWERSDENNYSLVINPTGTVAIAVATGDEATGIPDAVPTTKSSKGPSTVEVVTSNSIQLELPYEFPPIVAPSHPVCTNDAPLTWIFLVHRAQGEIRSELSLPTSMGTDCRVDGWRERIILNAIPTDPDTLMVTPPQPPLPDIDVDVKRRA